MDYLNMFKKRMAWVLLAAAMPAAGQAETVDGFSSPESVLAMGDQYLVANVGKKLDPTGKDGDGYISLVGPGAERKRDMFDGNVRLDAPKGMGIYQRVLYVADIDRLVGIDLETGIQVQELSFASKGVGFLNDVAISEAGTLYVSATDTGAIFQVNLNSGELVGQPLPIAPLPGPNGLYVDESRQRLIVASFGTDELPGELGVLSLETGEYRGIDGVNGLFDGVGLVDENTALVSDWGKFEPGAGELKTVDLRSGKVTVAHREASGPADFALLDDGRYVLPNMLDGTFTIGSLEP